MNRWRVCTLGETALCIHPSILLVLIYAALTGHFIFLLWAYISILLHESAHALTAAVFGYPPRMIELTPLGAVMHVEEDLSIPTLKRLFVITAGPATTFLIAALAVHGSSAGFIQPETGRQIFLANLSILMINLLPVFPLDGGRLLALLCGLLFPQSFVRKVLRWTGIIAGISLVLLNVWSAWYQHGWNLSLAFAGSCMIYTAAKLRATGALSELRALMDRKIRLERQGSLHAQCFLCMTSVPLQKLIRHLPPHKAALFLCMEPGSMKPVGMIDEFTLAQHYLKTPGAQIGICLLKSTVHL